jgi:hypothetical protein
MRILNYKFRKELDFEFGLNFKGLQSYSQKFTKIMSRQDLQEYNL